MVNLNKMNYERYWIYCAIITSKGIGNEEENYYAVWKYKDAYYELSGQIEKEEIVKILNEMQYNL